MNGSMFRFVPSPFGRGAGGEGDFGESANHHQSTVSHPALTLALSQRERGLP
jgi:hypothetical protein